MQEWWLVLGQPSYAAWPNEPRATCEPRVRLVHLCLGLVSRYASSAQVGLEVVWWSSTSDAAVAAEKPGRARELRKRLSGKAKRCRLCVSR